MYIAELFIENYRIFGAGDKALSVILNKGLNVIVGENDSGKTAIIDAIRHLLWTTSLDYNFVNEDDFHIEGNKRSANFVIRVCFRNLTPETTGRFLEWLSIDGDTPCLWVTMEATRREGQPATARRRNITTFVRSGQKGDGKPIEGEIREFLRTTYLKPLRDAESELAGGRGSRLSQILQAHPNFDEQKLNDYDQSNANTEPKTLVGILSQAQHKIKAHPVVEETKKDLDKNYLDLFSVGAEKLRSDIGVAKDTTLREILEKLELWLQPPMGTELRTRRGLGYNNLLFMATELLLLGQEKDFALPLLMIEEPEAHIHPQLQLRLMEFLERKSSSSDSVQIIVTTHSPNLASCVDIQSLFLMIKGNAYSLRAEETKLNTSDYGFLRRFLDVTKSNLFFAKAVVLVEGDAENILLPTIAGLLGRSFTEHGVSIVNVGHTGLFRYAKIFQRKDDGHMPIPVACLADRDIAPDEAAAYLKKGKRTFKDFSESELRKKVAKKQTHDGGRVQTFVSDSWTLEYDLARAGLYREMHIAIQLAKKSKGKLDALSKKETVEVIRQAEKEIDVWTANGDGPESIAARVYKPLYCKKASKPEAAQYLAACLRRSQIIQQHLLPQYLVKAIEHVTGGPAVKE